MENLLTLSYFRSSQIDVMFNIWDVLENKEHCEHTNLQRDLDSIEIFELDSFIEKYHANRMFGRFEDKELAKKVIYLTYQIQDAVASAIIKEISSNSVRQLPYSSNNLVTVIIDDHQLISAKYFAGRHGILINGFGYELCPSTQASNSMYWLGQAISKICSISNNDFRVRLHPFIEKSLQEYSPMTYLMTVHGKPLNWDKICTLRDVEFGQWMHENQNDDNAYTDYVWAANGKEVHFTCEEMPKHDVLGKRGSRYFHAIFNKETRNVTHCDGAIRLYEKDEATRRACFHLKDSEVRKSGKRIKLFQGDDLNLTTEQFTLLARCFFVWNQDAYNYFEAI